ncbi:MAG TPA: hypothetical protein VK459_16585 [Polyangiaceae bacterium]|nr:hypothetical protein [Polyangiaceae bacterium]
MTWAIVWGTPAKRALLSMPRHDAERVSAAVLRFAATGQGAEAPEGGPANARRLLLPGYRVLLALDVGAKRIWVKMIYRADR